MKFDTTSIEALTVKLSADPFNPIVSFQLAEEYRTHDQLASGVSFYLRCIEYGSDNPESNLHVYTSLLRLAEAFDSQKDRQWTVSNSILQAVSFMPDRPEAWFYLSRYYERQQQWQESYTYAIVGMDKFGGRLPAQTDYLGKFCLEFQMAVAGWWIGRRDESKETFEYLLTQSIPQSYKDSIKNNLERI